LRQEFARAFAERYPASDERRRARQRVPDSEERRRRGTGPGRRARTKSPRGRRAHET